MRCHGGPQLSDQAFHNVGLKAESVAVIILDADSNERLVTEDLYDLLTRMEPVAATLGCSDELAAVADIPRLGASYQRQRRVSE